VITVFTEDEDLKQGVKGFVFMFRSIWDEVDDQFSQLSKSERFRIFGIIAPIISDVMFYMPALGEEEELAGSRKGKRASK
jgi:hypothetical protein